MSQSFFDDYGYKNNWSQETIRTYTQIIKPRREANLKQWQYYIFNSDLKNDKINLRDPAFKQLVRKGIPDCYRPMIWCYVTGVDKMLESRKGLYEQLLSMTDTIPQTIKRVILADVPRTFPSSHTFSSDQLTNVLMAFAIAHPEIGYCQSLNFISALMIPIIGEEATCWMLCVLVEKYLPTDYYSNQMKSFQVDLRMMEFFIQERIPEVSRLAEQFGHNWILTVSGWLLTFYSNCFPVPTVLRIWDSFLLEGMKIIYRVGAAFLRMNQELILTADSRKKFVQTLNQLHSEMIDVDKLMDIAFSIKAFSRKHILEMR